MPGLPQHYVGDLLTPVPGSCNRWQPRIPETTGYTNPIDFELIADTGDNRLPKQQVDNKQVGECCHEDGDHIPPTHPLQEWKGRKQ